MKIRGEIRPVISFALVIIILLSILFPLLTGMSNALGIQESWQGAKSRWHKELSDSLRGSETGRESLTSLIVSLESDSFQALSRFSSDALRKPEQAAGHHPEGEGSCSGA